jgi:hypothetical protein
MGICLENAAPVTPGNLMRLSLLDAPTASCFGPDTRTMAFRGCTSRLLNASAIQAALRRSPQFLSLIVS